MDAQNKLKQIATPRNLDLQFEELQTVLMVATLKNDLKIVEMLLENGANVDLKNKDGKTAYDLAGQNDFISIMYQFNDQIIKNDTECNLIIKACETKNEKNVLFIYEQGANFFQQNSNGKSAFDILENHKELPERLQSLKEKLILDKELIEDDCQNFGL